MTEKMHPITHARTAPDRPAVIMAGSGEVLTYGAMDAMANRMAQWLRAQGLRAGDAFGVLMENTIHYHALFWASQRAGTVLVPISTHLNADEIGYILDDSDSRHLIATVKFADRLAQLAAHDDAVPQTVFGTGDADDAATQFAAHPASPIADQSTGRVMLYSSGTTGRPKGILPTPPEDPDVEAAVPLMMLARGFGIAGGAECKYLSPAPLYHAAPLGWSSTIHRLGGTVVVMEKFDAENALGAIEQYGITDSQWVPTHFVRMLKLPARTRERYDLTTHKCAIHAAAPCPADTKRAMIEWWGPILFEYYAGSEGNGMTMIGSGDWLTHEGSVGRAVLGTVHICDDDGAELPVGEEGAIFFESPYPFAYHKDAAKTAEATHPAGWTTLGDIGRLDADGFLYLTDRRTNMIISGGVNIYPQEIENLLVTHPKVIDAAVIGAPHDEMGEQVVAVVQPAEADAPPAALEAELAAFLETRLSRMKLPRMYDFRSELPREANGKLYKRKLKDEFAAAMHGSA